MSQERLAELIQARQEAIEAGSHERVTRETIIGILRALEKGDITQGRALHLFAYQAQRLNEQPAHAVLYRQAAADIRQMRA